MIPRTLVIVVLSCLALGLIVLAGLGVYVWREFRRRGWKWSS